MRPIFSTLFFLAPVLLGAQELYSGSAEALAYVRSAQYVSLGFATENMRTPLSTFGHTFLLFHNEEKPEIHAVAFEFYGDLRVDYFPLRALFSSVPGRFALTSFYHKAWSYEMEDRDIYVFRLKLSREERVRLSEKIAQNQSEEKPYNFFLSNCSHYVHETLLGALQESDCPRQIYTIPLASVHWLSRCQRIERVDLQPSLSRQALAAYDQLTPGEQKWLEQTDLNVTEISERSSPQLRRAASDLINYKIPRTRQEFHREHLLRQKRKILSNVVAQRPVEQGTLPERRSSMFYAGYESGPDQIVVGASPGVVTFAGAAFDQFWSDEVEILNGSLQFASGDVQLRSLTLFRLLSKQAPNLVSHGLTRLVELGYQREELSSLTYQQTAGRFATGYTATPQRNFKLALLVGAEVGRYFYRRTEQDLSALARVEIDWWLSRQWRLNFFYENYLGTHLVKNRLWRIGLPILDWQKYSLTASARSYQRGELAILSQLNYFY